MAIPSQDRYFSGAVKASTPYSLIPEGEVRRLINSRFVEGGISEGISLEKLEVTYKNDSLINLTSVSYNDILGRGDVQLAAPLESPSGKYLVCVISGVLFRIDLDSCIANDITPLDAYLPEDSSSQQLSYVANDGGVSGVGGTLVLYNFNNRPIFVTDRTSRLSDRNDFEMPPARMGVSAGNRILQISGRNFLYVSDPFGGGNANAPLTFQETLSSSGNYFGQVGLLGSSLGNEYVTGMCRLPKYLGPSQDFLAHSVYVTTRNHHYIIQANAPRDDWDRIQFVTYAGNLEGFAGPLASTSVGSNVVYKDTKGRIRTIAENQTAETSFINTHIDEDLGQYTCPCEHALYHRTWYSQLDHSKSVLKYAGGRLFSTEHPYYTTSLYKNGRTGKSISHRALGIGNESGDASVGSQSQLVWEGFLDYINPVSIVTYTDDTVIVISKNQYGAVEFYKLNLRAKSKNISTIYTRGHFVMRGPRTAPYKGATFRRGSLFFRDKLQAGTNIKISYLANGCWQEASYCIAEGNVVKFTVINPCKTNDSSIPLKIEIDHKGCGFYLASLEVEAETHNDI